MSRNGMGGRGRRFEVREGSDRLSWRSNWKGVWFAQRDIDGGVCGRMDVSSYDGYGEKVCKMGVVSGSDVYTFMCVLRNVAMAAIA